MTGGSTERSANTASKAAALFGQGLRQLAETSRPWSMKQLLPLRLGHRRHAYQGFGKRREPHRHAETVNQHDGGSQTLDREHRHVCVRPINKQKFLSAWITQRHDGPVSRMSDESGPAKHKLMLFDGKGGGFRCVRCKSGCHHNRMACPSIKVPYELSGTAINSLCDLDFAWVECLRHTHRLAVSSSSRHHGLVPRGGVARLSS